MYVRLRFLPKLGYLAESTHGGTYFAQESVPDNQIVKERGCGEHKFRGRRTHAKPSRSIGITQSHIGERTDPLEQQHVLNA